MSKVKKGFLIAGIVLAVLFIAFFATSFALAGTHGQSVVAEWQSWGTAIKEFFTGTAESVEQVEETAKMLIK